MKGNGIAGRGSLTCGAQDLVHSQKRRETRMPESQRSPSAALPGPPRVTRLLTPPHWLPSAPVQTWRSPDSARTPLWTHKRLVFLGVTSDCVSAPSYRPLWPPSPSPLRFCPFSRFAQKRSSTPHPSPGLVPCLRAEADPRGQSARRSHASSGGKGRAMQTRNGVSAENDGARTDIQFLS